MKRKVVEVITQGRITDSWITDCRNRMADVDLPLPTTDYKVVYTLAPKHGSMLAETGIGPRLYMINLKYKGDNYNKILNCLIPVEWVNLRFNRTVKPL